MFVASYHFEVHPNKNEEFEEAWKEVTQLIYLHCGSLGSRLYKSGKHSYFGIAQWPNKETWETGNIEAHDNLQWRAKMRECCVKIEHLAELELVHDLWMEKTFK